MSGRSADLDARVRAAAASAAVAVPGVAFLRPGFGDLLRGRAGRGPRGAGAIRVRRDAAPGAWDIRIELATRRGHRALDVTRSVRAAVLRAVAEETGAAGGPAGPPGVRVTVTVTGIA
ncbi:Asp23/Gls24 family envelope stress response protein [Streptomyces marincola]|uniref:Asp23/Gls24 family envelope stress response protein n=1 Tax=Streptomyces marincola TaxID=2878388 RepID=UPI001CF18DA0|nr:Asp23/Gls24 family envelope stress response protein [Streptomyces marincola]UCM87566.1 Asp23/Gls24 family envelope stress response protein [Streptomyces marincola]